MLNKEKLTAKMIERVRQFIVVNDEAQCQGEDPGWRNYNDFQDRYKSWYWIDDWERDDFNAEEAAYIADNPEWFEDCVAEAFFIVDSK